MSANSVANLCKCVGTLRDKCGDQTVVTLCSVSQQIASVHLFGPMMPVLGIIAKHTPTMKYNEQTPFYAQCSLCVLLVRCLQVASHFIAHGAYACCMLSGVTDSSLAE